MFLHDLVDVTKCGRMAGGHRAHWDVGSISVGACHSMHFRFVILAVLLGISHPAPLLPRYRKHSPQGPTLFVGFGIGGSGHVDRSGDHGFAQRPGTSGGLRRQIK
jgi:hypothetical protein